MIKLKINGYAFGKMVVEGREFTSDLIIYPDGRIQENWWRSQGHLLLLDDITPVFDSAPDKLVIGTGARGMMKVSEEVLALCNNCGIKAEACRTAMAVERFNESVEAGTVVAACFHLTC
ncbi:MAG: MTH938/NDUFAF3 family protein [Desulfobacterium sp.]|jgi:hypothetical protein|nr:MTH938/NDUFAF3 family protein [Desulfobacterium sp.]MDY0374716.1 MTH938/NDUFAF3 family protein [Desulfobacterium sp.]